MIEGVLSNLNEDYLPSFPKMNYVGKEVWQYNIIMLMLSFRVSLSSLGSRSVIILEGQILWNLDSSRDRLGSQFS